MRPDIKSTPLVAGILIRIILVLAVAPALHFEWFIPFLEHWISEPSLDPWSSWLKMGGQPEAFPYGTGMLLVGLPAGLMAHLLGEYAGSVTLLSTFFVADMLVLRKLLSSTRSRTMSLMWACSPLALYVTYVHGQTDVVFAASVAAALVLLRRKQWNTAGLWLGVAALFKLSALLFVPFVVVYSLRSSRDRVHIRRFFIVLCGVLVTGMVPAIYSDGFRRMVFGSRETGRLLDYSINLGQSRPFLLVPVVYLAMLYFLWRQGRTTVGVTVVISLAAMSVVVILAPSSVGWYLWFLPAGLILCEKIATPTLIALVALQVFAVSQSMIEEGSLETRAGSIWQIVPSVPSERTLALLQTLTLLSGLVATTSLVRRSLPLEDPYGVGQSPLSIGVAGDSGTGKDTLANALERLFPEGSCQIVEGDDYHLYERGAAEWTTLTHLNPIANDLTLLREDALKARRREPIRMRKYDHRTGRFLIARESTPGDLLVVNGLHALYLHRDRDLYDLKVFLRMEDQLREELKIERDSASRGANVEQVRDTIERRRPDATRFIEPQAAESDLEIELEKSPSTSSSQLRLACTVRCKKLSFPHRLSNAMNSIVLVKHKLEQGRSVDEVILTVDANDMTSEDYRVLIDFLEPKLLTLMTPSPVFSPGTLGFQTLLLLLAVAERRTSLER